MNANDSSLFKGVDMTIEYHGAPSAGANRDRLIRALADEFASAKLRFDHKSAGAVHSFDFALEAKTFDANLTVTTRPSTHFELNRH